MTSVIAVARGKYCFIMADSCISWPVDNPRKPREYVYKDELQKVYLITPNFVVAYCGDLRLLKDIHRELHKKQNFKVLIDTYDLYADKSWKFSSSINRLLDRMAKKSIYRRKYAEITYAIIDGNRKPRVSVWISNSKAAVTFAPQSGVIIRGSICRNEDLCLNIERKLIEVTDYPSQCPLVSNAHVASFSIGGVPEVVEIPERLSGAGKLGQRVELFE